MTWPLIRSPRHRNEQCCRGPKLYEASESLGRLDVQRLSQWIDVLRGRPGDEVLESLQMQSDLALVISTKSTLDECLLPWSRHALLAYTRY